MERWVWFSGWVLGIGRRMARMEIQQRWVEAAVWGCPAKGTSSPCMLTG